MKYLAILSVVFAMTHTVVLADDCESGTEQSSAKSDKSSENNDPSKILIQDKK